ncbi:MAG: HupE/UreJ family protein, partial [Candidatus Acidiferrales bacterium]
IAAIFFAIAAAASAHRLDEYLQATILCVEKDRLDASVRLIPGVAVSSEVIASIDTDGDGLLSDSEQHAYAVRVLSDLSLSIDGARLTPKLVSLSFPTIAQMKDGLGEIHIDFVAVLPSGDPNRKLTLENRHQLPISVYLVNVLVPRDPDIQVVAQNRNSTQSHYELVYVQAEATSGSRLQKWWRGLLGWSNSVGFASVFRLGMRHIAEGTDHLLFLLALLLPAPLLVVGLRWAGFADLRRSLLKILKIVTAFTIGHSITLALAAMGVVHVPSRPVEVLIAVSILVSAIHALRPIFPGKEAAIAAFFGLVHGLAFASTLGQLGLGRWERVAGILAFNLGIETMQLVVVAVTLPSLILMSRTSAYPALRIGGALFAGCASIGWIADRLCGLANPFDAAVAATTRHAPAIAVILFVTSVICWLAWQSSFAAQNWQRADPSKLTPEERRAQF